MRIGVVVMPTGPWPETREQAVHVDALGYDHLWTYDHLSWRHYRERPWHASFVWLTAMAALTDNVRLGPLVASPNFRHPVNLAKEAMSLDHVSGGRVILGVGAGGPGFDSTVLGDPMLAPGALAARLEEFIDLLDRLLREPRVSHDGARYTVDDARMIPGCVQQPRLPIAVAAARPRTFALAARVADAWITHAGTLGEIDSPANLDAALRTQVAAFERVCEAQGRDPGTIDRYYMSGFEPERPLASVEQFRDFADRIRAAGFTDLVVHHPRADDPQRDDPPEILDQVAAELLPQLQRADP